MLMVWFLSYNGVLANCNMSNIGPLAMDMSKEAAAAAGGDDCVAYQVQAQQQMGSINIYDIYVDVCVGDDEVGACGVAVHWVPCVRRLPEHRQAPLTH